MKTPISGEQFIRLFLPAAIAAEKKTGMPRFFTLAMHESEQGPNATPPGNMCFGIKAGPKWKGLRQLLTTWEVFDTPNVKWPFPIIKITLRKDGKFRYDLKDEFRAYATIGESYDDLANFLTVNPRYKAAWQHTGPGNEVGFTTAVVKAGYATDPNKLKIMLDTIARLKKKAEVLGLSSPPPA